MMDFARSSFLEWIGQPREPREPFETYDFPGFRGRPRYIRRAAKKKKGPRKSLKGVPRNKTANPAQPRKGAVSVTYSTMNDTSISSGHNFEVVVSVPSQPFTTVGSCQGSHSKGKGRGRGHGAQSRTSCTDACCVLETNLKTSATSLMESLPTQRWLAIGGRTDSLGLRSLIDRGSPSFAFTESQRQTVCASPGSAAEWQPVGLAAALDTCELCNPVKATPKKNGRGFANSAHRWELEKADRAHKVLLRRRPAPLDVEINRSSDFSHCQMRLLVRPVVPIHRLVGKYALRRSSNSTMEFWWRVSTEAPYADARSRHTMNDDVKFTLLSNAEDAPHQQPPHFSEYSLRPEQLRSLNWMVQQEESTEPFVQELLESIPVPDLPNWYIEGRARCAINVRGGVLGDKIGYGKTAVTIGLIDCTLQQPLPKAPPNLIPSKATLVLCPTNLQQQWVDEVRKFTGGSLRVLSVQTCAQLRSLRVRDLQDADVVVATYRLFYSDRYLERIAALVRRSQQDHAKFDFPAAESAEFEASYEEAFTSLEGWAAEVLPDVVAKRDDDQHAVGKRKGRGRGGSRAKKDEGGEQHVRVSGGDASPRGKVGKGKGKVPRHGIQCSSPHQSVEQSQSPNLHTPTRSAIDRANGEAGFAAENSPSSSIKLPSPDAEMQGGHALAEDSSAQAAIGPPKKRRVIENAVEPGPGEDQRSFKYPPLEVFFWRRVVFDEFHELLRNYPPALVAARLFQSGYRFGLSGTPPINSIREVQTSARLFGVALPSKSASPHSAKMAQEWIDRCMRQNTAVVAPVAIKEDIILVHQSPAERALYLQQAQEYAVNANEINLANAEHLLKLCSHFHDGTEQGSAETAEDQCTKVLTRLKKQVKVCEKSCLSRLANLAEVFWGIRYFDPDFVSPEYAAIMAESAGPVRLGESPEIVVVDLDCAPEKLASAAEECPQPAAETEKRIAEDGSAYSKQEFIDELGSYLGKLAWDQAKPSSTIEKRKVSTSEVQPQASDATECTPPAALTLRKRLNKKTRVPEAIPTPLVDPAHNQELTIGDEILNSSAYSGDIAAQFLDRALSSVENPIKASFDRAEVSTCCKALSAKLGISSKALLNQPKDSEELPGRKLVRGAQAASLKSEIDSWKSTFSDLLKKIGSTRAELESAISSHRFFTTALNASSSGEECPVCLERPQNAMLPCAHLACHECLTRIAAGLDGAALCPICRRAVRPQDVYRFTSAEFRGQDPTGQLENPMRFAKFGSKIKVLVEHLNKIWAREPEARIIVFVQWEDLKEKLSKAFVEFKVAHLTLQGNVWARREALSKFKAPISQQHPRVLLLSLEASASGTNLTEANHVVLVHPMCAANQPTAVAYEMQAIGRVARPGQTKEVNVWRFVTADSVESALTERHQRELWSRRSAASTVVSGAASSSSDHVVSEDRGNSAASNDRDGSSNDLWSARWEALANDLFGDSDGGTGGSSGSDTSDTDSLLED